MTRDPETNSEIAPKNGAVLDRLPGTLKLTAKSPLKMDGWNMIISF